MTPHTLDDLGLPGAVYLWALLHAQQHRLALAPTADLAMEALMVLASHQIVALPEDGSGSAIGQRQTPIEGIAWRWIWRAYNADSALRAVEDFLTSVPRDDLVLTLGAALWQRLVRDEAQAFYAEQLARCQFDAHWQQDMAFAQRLSKLSLRALWNLQILFTCSREPGTGIWRTTRSKCARLAEIAASLEVPWGTRKVGWGGFEIAPKLRPDESAALAKSRFLMR